MDCSELGSFLQKFRSLWKSGLDAHLDVHTSAGQAWVGLRVRLGHAPGPLHGIQPFSTAHQARNRNGPARQRRRSQRAAARAAQAEGNQNENLETNASDAVEADFEQGINENGALDAHTDVQVEQSDETSEETIVEIDETEEVAIEASENEENAAVTTACDDMVVESDDLDIDQEKMETTEVVEKVNNVVVVDATATFENCPDSELCQEYVESLSRFIFSKEHLKRNICKVETSYISSRHFRNNTYTHTLSVKLSVLPGGLLEGPRSYLWRHLGDDTWTRGNQTTIRLVKDPCEVMLF